MCIIDSSKREIYIETGEMVAISEEMANSLLTENYNGQKIQYLFVENETDNNLTVSFEIKGKTYYVSAKYSKDADSDTLKADITFLLEQMVKQ